ncbi:uncharacterized protein LOC115761509 [Drosophila novamexicana]|uniref:uncharacterized protein LOC115761509 n=1 Tax=Drosophila novamexicana TaxID=47314 RepID=UPI0011E5BAF6|nr:uncharacterized protein LOC115761509 [Drosophila novamexicana]
MATDYSDTSPVVLTTHGEVRGALLTSLFDELYYSFDGIPYAQPPLGELRFRAPQNAESWLGVRDCTEPRDKCLQVASLTKQVEGSEDCLYLNIAVKSLTSKKPLPVMVYVHGGAFKSGDPTRRFFSPDYFMREQVIYISIGYRLGPFGFMSFSDPSLGIPGNAGIKDIVLALKWIRANVRSFNGDANNITLFGHSSGSCLVHLLMVSPLAEGLFDKAILLAGFHPDTCNRPNVEYELAKHLGYEGANNDVQVWHYLNAADPKLLAKTDFRQLYERLQSSGLPLFMPRVEPYATQGAVLLDEPRILQRSAWSNRLPIIIGSTSNEDLFSSTCDMTKDAAVLKACQERPEFMLPYSILRRCEPSACRHLGQTLVKKFCGVHSSDLNVSHASGISEIFALNLLHYQQRLISARLAYSQAENYLYRFDFDSPDFNLYRIRYWGPERRGLHHADELCYIFKLPGTFKLDKSRAEYITLCRMIAMFTEFARRSNPNAPLIQSLVDWQPVSQNEPTMCLNINEELKFIAQPERLKLMFYEQLYRNATLRRSFDLLDVQLTSGTRAERTTERLFSIMSESLETCEIELPVGQIRGVKRRTLYDDDYFSFECLPFAQPPLGELRFKAPLPAKPWSGVLDCTHFAEKPVQKAMLTGVIEGSEDCLYLNVYAKQLKTAKPLPVMVYIYGGAFSIGEATRELYAPDYFMAKDVVLVTLNYRVDCLGFLSLKDPSLEVPGNAGLKDQVLALKWVKQYISHFNGDVNNITVFGESAGGCSTHYMMCTEQTRGLFHKAIPMSGTLHNYWSNTPPADFAYRLAKAHGYEGENIDRLVLEHLRGVAPHQLVNHSLLTAEDRRNGLIYAFGPTVEPYIMPDCVAPKRQLEMAREAWSNELPVMMGGVSFEGLFMYPALKANLKGLDTLPQDPLRIIPYEVLLLNTKQQNLEFSNKLIKLYFGDARPSSEHIMNFLDYYSYKIFWHGFHRTLQARLAYAKAPTYYYRFDFDSPDFNFYRKKFCGDDIKKGVAHADELSYLFRNSQSWKLDKASGEYRTIQRLVEIWTSFAATSNPNCAETAHLNWQPAQQELPQRVLNIDNEVKIIDQPEHEKLLVWDSLYKKEQLF